MSKRSIKNCIMILAALCIMALCAGCTASKTQEQQAAVAREVEVYLLDADGITLDPVKKVMPEGDAVEQAGYLVDLLISARSDGNHRSPFKTNTEFIDCKVNKNTLLVYFDSLYAKMDLADRTLCDAALARTLTQINGIEYIRIFSGYVAITDGRGNQVGRICAADYVDSISDVNAYTDSDITLYFSNETGDMLIPENRRVVYNMNTTLERKVVEELIRGPVGALSKMVISPTVRLISISTANEVCYVNFNDEFLTAVPDVNSEIPIYAIVNSLTALPYINKVQIMVDSAQNVLFMENMPLNRAYERDEDLIYKLYDDISE